MKKQKQNFEKIKFNRQLRQVGKEVKSIKEHISLIEIYLKING
jgi:hypothetical protein